MQQPCADNDSWVLSPEHGRTNCYPINENKVHVTEYKLNKQPAFDSLLTRH